MKITIDDIMAWSPCQSDYSRDRVEELFDGRKHLTPIDVARLDIPFDDRLWALVRMCTDDRLREFVCRCAERALQTVWLAGYEPDQRSWDVIDITRQWMAGLVNAAAWYAARDAAWDAAWAIAWDAARDAVQAAALVAVRAAVRDIAWDAARVAVQAAARVAAWYAVWDAAWDAERSWQSCELSVCMGGWR